MTDADESANQSHPLHDQQWTDGDLVLVAWRSNGGVSTWTDRIVGERMGDGGPKPHRIDGAVVTIIERGAEGRDRDSGRIGKYEHRPDAG